MNRRRFIEASMGAAGALAALPYVSAQVGEILTPVSIYSDAAWAAKAQTLHASLTKVVQECGSRFKPERFRLLSTTEATVGGVGLWPNPVKFGETSRYLGVFGRALVPPPASGRAFPDTESGRILTIFDAYGKELMGVLAKQLEAISDPGLAGAVIVFIYGKSPIASADFENSAEAMGLFMPRDAVITFAQLRMTVQALFSKSETLPLLKGAEQIGNLRQYIMQP